MPCFNEASRLDEAAFVEFVRRKATVQILFVDDGSTDATDARLRSIADRDPRHVKILSLPQNMGKGEAVRAGLLEAILLKPEYVGYWDADLATPLDVLEQFVAYLEAHPYVNMVLGSRVLMLGREIRRRRLRHYLGRAAATLVTLILRASVYDTQCGAKLLRVTDSLRELLARPFVSRWLFDVEMLARIAHSEEGSSSAVLNRRVHELPLQSWTDIEGSKIRAMDLVRLPEDLVRIWRTYR